jgi:hypothetical protein
MSSSRPFRTGEYVRAFGVRCVVADVRPANGRYVERILLVWPSHPGPGCGPDLILRDRHVYVDAAGECWQLDQGVPQRSVIVERTS